MLQHQRLGHIGEKGLLALKDKNLVNGLNYCALEFYFCEHLIYRKLNRVLFYSSSHKYSRLLDLIQSDVFGPIKTLLILKPLYYVSFIDDYFRRTCTYFLRTKSEVFSQFKEFKSLLEN
jgi:hypothetical protein